MTEEPVMVRVLFKVAHDEVSRKTQSKHLETSMAI
jgi:hypothetical protein